MAFLVTLCKHKVHIPHQQMIARVAVAQRTAVKITAFLQVKLLARSRLKEVFSQQPHWQMLTIIIRFPKERH